MRVGDGFVWWGVVGEGGNWCLGHSSFNEQVFSDQEGCSGPVLVSRPFMAIARSRTGGMRLRYEFRGR